MILSTCTCYSFIESLHIAQLVEQKYLRVTKSKISMVCYSEVTVIVFILHVKIGNSQNLEPFEHETTTEHLKSVTKYRFMEDF